MVIYTLLADVQITVAQAHLATSLMWQFRRQEPCPNQLLVHQAPIRVGCGVLTRQILSLAELPPRAQSSLMAECILLVASTGQAIPVTSIEQQLIMMEVLARGPHRQCLASALLLSHIRTPTQEQTRHQPERILVIYIYLVVAQPVLPPAVQVTLKTSISAIFKRQVQSQAAPQAVNFK